MSDQERCADCGKILNGEETREVGGNYGEPPREVICEGCYYLRRRFPERAIRSKKRNLRDSETDQHCKCCSVPIRKDEVNLDGYCYPCYLIKSMNDFNKYPSERR